LFDAVIHRNIYQQIYTVTQL